MAKSSAEIFDTTGIPINEDACIVIVRTAWNKTFLDELEKGCLTILNQNNVKYIILEVPGAVEISFIIQHYWATHLHQKPAAFIALGCVIKGDTPHFEYVCNSVTQGVTQLNLHLPVPVIFGVLTVNTEAQALERLGGKHGHKGEEAAATAIKMIALADSFKQNI